jgi:hypothetical protein
MPNKKRNSKKVQNIIDTLFFYVVTCLSIGGLVLYLWVYTEIDDSLYALDIQRETVEELMNNIHLLQSEIDALSRPDVIARKAKMNWGMVFAKPESISIHIKPGELSSL